MSKCSNLAQLKTSHEEGWSRPLKFRKQFSGQEGGTAQRAPAAHYRAVSDSDQTNALPRLQRNNDGTNHTPAKQQRGSIDRIASLLRYLSLAALQR
jgi:hypothetical protein